MKKQPTWSFLARVSLCFVVAFGFTATLLPRRGLCSDGSDNCAQIGSCGLPGCKTIRGGSQFIYNNNIPACINKDRNCYETTCRVKAYTTSNCSGEILDEMYIERLGCRKSVGVPQ